MPNTESKTTKYHKVGCRCGSKIMCKSPITGDMMKDAGWGKINGTWYCDECEPYERSGDPEELDDAHPF